MLRRQPTARRLRRNARTGEDVRRRAFAPVTASGGDAGRGGFASRVMYNGRLVYSFRDVGGSCVLCREGIPAITSARDLRYGDRDRCEGSYT